jgi:hypothetical protein
MLGAAGEQDAAVGLGQRGHRRRDAPLRVRQRGGEHDLHLVGGRHRGQGADHVPRRAGGLALKVREAQRLAHCGDPFVQRGGQDALDLGQRGGHARHGVSEAFGGQEPDDDRGGLVVGEHQRWQAVTREQPVPAVAPALGDDRDPEVAQAQGVASDGPLIHAEPGGQFRAGQLAAGLQQLQHGQHPGGRM